MIACARKGFQSGCQTVTRLWKSVQVKWRGHYSTTRFRDLRSYVATTQLWRTFCVLAITPAPSLSVITLFEVIPLNSPDAGLDGNHKFFLREFIIYFVFCLVLLQQFSTQVGRSLPLSVTQLIMTSLLVAVANVSFSYLLASVIGFPVPFTMIATTPSHLILETTLLGIQWYPYVHTNPGIVSNIVRGGIFFSCQALMITVYPLYFYAFTLIPDGEVARPAFFCLLPVLKYINRQIFQRVTRKEDGGDELTTLMIVFNADVPGALFVVFCIQFQPSVVMAVGLAISKVFMALVSLHEIRIATRKLFYLRQRGMHTRSLLKSPASFEIYKPGVSALDEVGDIIDRYKMNSPCIRCSEGNNVKRDSFFQRWMRTKIEPTQPGEIHPTSHAFGPAKTYSYNSKVKPIEPSVLSVVADRVNSLLDDTSNDPTEVLSAEQADCEYASYVLKLLSAMEFMILAEYVEVIVPILYSLYLIVMYHLPNRAYYAQFVSMNPSHLVHSVCNVLLFTIVELVSLVVVHWNLNRLLRVSPSRQLAFVLSREAVHVQSMLILWFVYSTQASLAHFGNDLSFRFDWLNKRSPSGAL